MELPKNLVRQIILRYVDSFRDEANSDVQELPVFDDERGHYQCISLGWENGKRVFYVHLYVRLQNEKIWIEKDTTEDGIAKELLSEEVPHSDIVLAFHSPKDATVHRLCRRVKSAQHRKLMSKPISWSF